MQKPKIFNKSSSLKRLYINPSEDETLLKCKIGDNINGYILSGFTDDNRQVWVNHNICGLLSEMEIKVFINANKTIEEIAELFGLSVLTIKSYISKIEKKGVVFNRQGNPRKPNQKAFSLKVDNDLLEFLQENKPVNRFINDMIRNKKNSRPTQHLIDFSLNLDNK